MGDPNAKPDLAGIAGLAAWLQQNGTAQETFELRSVVDPAFVPEIATFK